MDMDIIIQDEGIITPFNIQSSRETRFTILPQTRDAVDEKEAADGDIDFGTWFGMGEFNLHGIIEFDTIAERNAAADLLRKQLNDCRTPQTISYECTPERYNVVQLTGRPEITRFPCYIEVKAQFKAYPFWLDVTEKSLAGNGVIANEGTFECPILIEIPGSATSPTVSVGTSVISFASAIAVGQSLVIDTGTQTAKIGSVNAMAYVSGDIDYMLPPNVSVAVTPSVSGTTVKWRDCWL